MALSLAFDWLSAAGKDGVNLSALLKGGGVSVQGMLRDISLGGCALATWDKRTFAAGDFVRLRVALTSEGATTEFLAAVVGVRPLPSDAGGGRILHLRFMALSETAKTTLAQAVRRLQEATRAVRGMDSARRKAGTSTRF